MDLSITLRDILLTGHVVTAIVLIGPLIVASIMFPTYARQALDGQAVTAVLTMLHGITRAYGSANIVVALLGAGLAFEGGLWNEFFVWAGIALWLGTGAVVSGLMVPAQSQFLDGLANDAADETVLPRLSVLAWLDALVWVLIVLVMIAKPEI